MYIFITFSRWKQPLDSEMVARDFSNRWNWGDSIGSWNFGKNLDQRINISIESIKARHCRPCVAWNHGVLIFSDIKPQKMAHNGFKPQKIHDIWNMIWYMTYDIWWIMTKLWYIMTSVARPVHDELPTISDIQGSVSIVSHILIVKSQEVPTSPTFDGKSAGCFVKNSHLFMIQSR